MALNPQIITDAALKIASEFGLGDLSMRRLARELGVQPSALYWHVANKQEVFTLIASRIAQQVDAVFGLDCPGDAPHPPAAHRDTPGTVDNSAALPPGRVGGYGKAATTSAPEVLTVVTELRRALSRYRDGAEIYLLAYALKGVEIAPRSLTVAVGQQVSIAEVGATIDRILAFVLGWVAIEQNRRLYGTEESGAPDLFVPHAAVVCGESGMRGESKNLTPG